MQNYHPGTLSSVLLLWIIKVGKSLPTSRAEENVTEWKFEMIAAANMYTTNEIHSSLKINPEYPTVDNPGKNFTNIRLIEKLRLLAYSLTVILLLYFFPEKNKQGNFYWITEQLDFWAILTLPRWSCTGGKSGHSSSGVLALAGAAIFRRCLEHFNRSFSIIEINWSKPSQLS